MHHTRRSAAAHILAALAEFERARIAERVTAGLARARRQGKTLGRPRLTRPPVVLPKRLTVRQAANAWGVSKSTSGPLDHERDSPSGDTEVTPVAVAWRMTRAPMPRSALRTSIGYAPESKDTVLDRGMSREIGAQAERVRTPIEVAEALKDADGPRGVEAGRTHESEA